MTKHEEGTLSYKLSWGDEDPDSLIIFERYVSKDYLENVGVGRESKTATGTRKVLAEMEGHSAYSCTMRTSLMHMGLLANKRKRQAYPLAVAAKCCCPPTQPGTGSLAVRALQAVP